MIGKVFFTTAAEGSSTTAAERSSTTAAESSRTTAAESSAIMAAQDFLRTVVKNSSTAKELLKKTLHSLTFVITAAFLSTAHANDGVSVPETTPKPEETRYTMVTLKTSAGDIKISLNAGRAPISVENFLAYANAGQYDGTIFHRVIKGFMVQGGGFEPGMKQKPVNAPIVNEANNGLLNNKYTLAMARTSDPHSATAQFFINAKDNDFLNFSSETSSGWGYAVFGEVVSGQEIVDAIENVATGQSGAYGDVPIEDIVINSVVVEQ